MTALEELEIFCRNSLKEASGDNFDWAGFTRTLYTLWDRSTELLLADKTADCRKGCSYCCFHWVEDVYSFEFSVIEEYINRNLSHRLNRISIESHGASNEMEKIVETYPDSDEIEILNRFYTLAIPCPLLDSSGNCLIYPVRPLTCRSFFSRSSERFCSPDALETEEQGTFMTEIPESSSAILDELHRLYIHGDDVSTSLRQMLCSVYKKSV